MLNTFLDYDEGEEFVKRDPSCIGMETTAAAKRGREPTYKTRTRRYVYTKKVSTKYIPLSIQKV